MQLFHVEAVHVLKAELVEVGWGVGVRLQIDEVQQCLLGSRQEGFHPSRQGDSSKTG
jgi:hypothetical protein